MIERLVEDWLTEANELSFELPFCQMLQAEGWSVLHRSRHGEHEQGKDIIAVSPEGVPAAFQLKGTSNSGKIRQREWQEYRPQITRLVEIPIIHPSVDKDLPRRVFFVTNGELDEPVRREIDDWNVDLERRSLPRLEIIVKGEFLSRIKKIQSDFWPTNPFEVKLLLELFGGDGRAILNKEKLWTFLVSTVPFAEENLSEKRFSRSVASAGIFCTYVLSPFERAGNHVAVIEGWSMYLALCLSLAEKNSIASAIWRPYVDMTRVAIESPLRELCEEVLIRDHFVEGDAVADICFHAFYLVRATWVLAMAACWDLWCRASGNATPERLREVLERHENSLKVITEADIPKFLAIMWFFSKTGGDRRFELYCRSLIKEICASNTNMKSPGLASPYYESVDVMRLWLTENDGENETFSGRSFTIEALVQLLSRRNLKQEMKQLWPEVSKLIWCTYIPAESWQFYWWRLEDAGELRSVQPPLRQSWAVLRDESLAPVEDEIPTSLRLLPEFMLLFTLVMPHRLNAAGARFLDSWVRSLPHGRIRGANESIVTVSNET